MVLSQVGASCCLRWLQVFKGMFGGYSAYDHFVCSSFCSLQRAATLAAGLHRLHIVSSTTALPIPH